MTHSNVIDELEAGLVKARAKAKAEGYILPDGTYTFTNQEGAVVNMALNITRALLDGDLQAALFTAAVLTSKGKEVEEILARISNSITDKQCPPYVTAMLDELDAKARETDPRLS